MFPRKIINYLVNWKNKKSRKPLILRGARQVGKTSSVLLFGRNHFKNIVNLNLENVEHQRLFNANVSLDDFIKIIRIKFKQEIVEQETLIFLDEIQNAPSLIKLLRFFYELMPEVHVIASGSLLEVILEREGFSFPVGRVEFAYMYPLDFFEFLQAKEEIELLDYLNKVPIDGKIPSGIHTVALKQFYEYTMIGGMPEIVQQYLETKDLVSLKPVYSALLTGYCEDVYKYSSLANAKYLNYVIEKSPENSGSLITYEKFGGSSFRSREMGRAFNTLEKIMLLHLVQATKSIKMPLQEQPKRPKKLLFLDVGLVNYQMGVQENFLDIKDLNDLYRGSIAEQVVGQNLLAQFNTSLPKILYWIKEKAEGSAELDFCMLNQGKIMGIEVKSGVSNKLKSLWSFAELVPKSFLVRIYSGNLKEETIQRKGHSVKLLSIPFYLLPRILELSSQKS